MGTGSSELLRLLPARRACAALLAVLAVTIGAPVAEAVTASPDPSPATGAVSPDPYPTVRTPAEPVASPAATAPVQRQRQVTHVAAATTAPHRARVVPAKRSTPRKTALPKHKAAPVRTPDHPAPRLVALGRTVLEPPHRTSRTLAVALGLLVLLSASLVAGAARELAR